MIGDSAMNTIATSEKKREAQEGDVPHARVDTKLEIVVIPVSDIDRAKEFYGGKLGWRLDADYDNGSDFRVIQFTPPGSAAAPGSAQGLYLIVSDLAATRAELLGHGVGVSEVFHNDGRSEERR